MTTPRTADPDKDACFGHESTSGPAGIATFCDGSCLEVDISELSKCREGCGEPATDDGRCAFCAGTAAPPPSVWLGVSP